MNAPRPDLQAHYGRPGLLEALAPLLDACTAGEAEAALARVDEFHPGGRAATDALVRLAAPRPGERVLDLGCGIGGPARRLRRLVGDGGAVTGVDVVGEYCRAARALNARDPACAGIAIEQADVTALDLPGPPYDLVWSQQAQMNVPDKAAWLAAACRHLRRGGRYAFFEAFAGPAGAVRYPVPWAARADDSHLVTPEAWQAGLALAGLAPQAWRDCTADVVAWLDEAVAAGKALAAAGDPAAALSVRLLLGPDAALMSRNLRANLADGRLCVAMGVAGRPA